MLDITSYIKHFPNALNKSTAQLVVDHYYKNAPWRKSSFATNTGLSPASSKKVLMNEYWIKKGDMYYDDLKKSFRHMVIEYCKIHSKIIPERFTDFRLNHYSEGGFMKNHIDNIHHSHGQKFGYPHITALMFLNDNYEGGEIVLCDGVYEPQKKQGSGIVFPSNFMFPHEVKKVIKGHRYSLMTWIL